MPEIVITDNIFWLCFIGGIAIIAIALKWVGYLMNLPCSRCGGEGIIFWVYDDKWIYEEQGVVCRDCNGTGKRLK